MQVVAVEIFVVEHQEQVDQVVGELEMLVVLEHLEQLTLAVVVVAEMDQDQMEMEKVVVAVL